MEKYSRSYRFVSAPLLGAIYLIALGWWDYDRELSNRPLPDIVNLRKQTLLAIQNSYHCPKLDCIEAMLLLLQCKPEDPLNPDHTWNWGRTGQAISIGQALGIHLDASSWSIPNWERALRKRVSWSLYMQDKLTALAHGRLSHLTNDDWMVTDLDITDFETRTFGEDGETREKKSFCYCIAKVGAARFIQEISPDQQSNQRKFSSLHRSPLDTTSQRTISFRPTYHPIHLSEFWMNLSEYQQSDRQCRHSVPRISNTQDTTFHSTRRAPGIQGTSCHLEHRMALTQVTRLPNPAK